MGRERLRRWREAVGKPPSQPDPWEGSHATGEAEAAYATESLPPQDPAAQARAKESAPSIARRCAMCHADRPVEQFAPLPEGSFDRDGSGLDVVCRFHRAMLIARADLRRKERR